MCCREKEIVGEREKERETDVLREREKERDPLRERESERDSLRERERERERRLEREEERTREQRLERERERYLETILCVRQHETPVLRNRMFQIDSSWLQGAKLQVSFFCFSFCPALSSWSIPCQQPNLLSLLTVLKGLPEKQVQEEEFTWRYGSHLSVCGSIYPALTRSLLSRSNLTPCHYIL